MITLFLSQLRVSLTVTIIVSLNTISAQRIFQAGLKGEFFSIPISKSTISIGDSDIETTGKIKSNEALYAEFYYWGTKNIGILAGAGIHSLRYEVGYKVPYMYDNVTYASSDFHTMQAVQWSPVIGLAYRNKRFMSSLSLVTFGVISSENSGSSGTSFIYVPSDVVGSLKSVYKIEEQIEIIADFNQYAKLQAHCQFEIARNLYATAGLETTLHRRGPASMQPGGVLDQYSVRIYDISDQAPVEGTLLRDFRLTARYTGVTFGLSYYLSFGKYKWQK